MTEAQKARRDANDAQKELRSLASKEDSSAENIETATKKLNDLETRAEALERVEPVTEPVTEPTEDASVRELRSLESIVRARAHRIGHCGRASGG